MFGRMKFRVMIKQDLETAKEFATLLKREGFKLYNVLETGLQDTATDEKVQDVYLLCCKGSKSNYDRFKHKHQLSELNDDGIKTLY